MKKMISYSIILLVLPLYCMEQSKGSNKNKKVTFSTSSDNNNEKGKTLLDQFSELPKERRQEITKRMRELTSDSKIDMKSHEEKKEWKNDVYSYFAGEVTEIKTENKLYGYSAIDKLHKRIQQQNTSSSDKN